MGTNFKQYEETFEKVVYSNKTNVNRYLYDFFDEKGIHAAIWAYEISPLLYKWAIYGNIGGVLTFNTRTEAEEAAFLKAFELLEQQLNK
jgi:hypothetical protein